MMQDPKFSLVHAFFGSVCQSVAVFIPQVIPVIFSVLLRQNFSLSKVPSQPTDQADVCTLVTAVKDNHDLYDTEILSSSFPN